MSGYLAMLETAKPAQKPLMTKRIKEFIEDTELYSWEPVRGYHAVWLQQIENGRVNWDHSEAKLVLLCQALVWHSVHSAIKPDRAAPAAPAVSLEKPEKGTGTTSVAAKPATCDCAAYNEGASSKQDQHPKELHICTYCLEMASGSELNKSAFADGNSLQQQKTDGRE